MARNNQGFVAPLSDAGIYKVEKGRVVVRVANMLTHLRTSHVEIDGKAASEKDVLDTLEKNIGLFTEKASEATQKASNSKRTTAVW